MNVLDLFSGIGGFSLGLERAGMKTVAFCEIEKYPQQVLKKIFPGVPIYDDVRTITAERLAADGIDTIDLICGGFPCQPFSVAGKQRGKDDDRHLWPEMFRLIKECQPTWVIGENVAGFVNMALDDVCTDLENASYEVQPFIIPACAVNAPHRRDRVWIVAHSRLFGQAQCQEQATGIEQCNQSDVPDTISNRLQRGWQDGNIAGQIGLRNGAWSHEEPELRAASPEWSVKSPFCGVADGIPRRMDRLKALGNAVVPQIPEIIGRAIMAVSH